MMIGRTSNFSVASDGEKQRTTAWSEVSEAPLTLAKWFSFFCVLVIVSTTLAWIPLSMPLGDPFGGRLWENWAYYFWYNPFGWGIIFSKLTVFMVSLHEAEFGWRCVVAIAIPIFVTVAFFFAGGIIFRGPTPLGTCAGLVFCFTFVAVPLNFQLLVSNASFHDKSCRASLERCLASYVPFFLWAAQLCCNVAFLAWTVSTEDGPFMYVLLALQPLMNAGFCCIPFRWFFARARPRSLSTCDGEHDGTARELGLIYKSGFWIIDIFFQATTKPVLRNWTQVLFQMIVSELVVQGLNFVNFKPSWKIQVKIRRADSDTLDAATNVAALHRWRQASLYHVLSLIAVPMFLVLSAWDLYGPNAGMFYIYDELSESAIRLGFSALLVQFVIKCMSAAFFVALLKALSSDNQRTKLVDSLRRCKELYSLNLVLVMAASAMAANQCMVMKHDGMDPTFQFSWI